MKRTLKRELTEVLNKHCVENESNTPDFILAEFMLSCLHAFEKASNDRQKWYGVDLHVGMLSIE